MTQANWVGGVPKHRQLQTIANFGNRAHRPANTCPVLGDSQAAVPALAAFKSGDRIIARDG